MKTHGKSFVYEFCVFWKKQKFLNESFSMGEKYFSIFNNRWPHWKKIGVVVVNTAITELFRKTLQNDPYTFTVHYSRQFCSIHSTYISAYGLS